jgi:acetolactate synthase-1/2/3 large subunit
MSAKYSDQFMDWLKTDGYTTCFFVGGGNVMHLLESASRRFKCIPVVHEVAAGIAAEYFNENNKFRERAFALVTAGPGLTNIVTAIGGAFLESRELLVIGGQAKVSDLAHGRVPQIGHQEIDGIGIVNKITLSAIQADRRLTKEEVLTLTARSRTARKGPVFIEMCIDVSAMPEIEDSNGNFLQPIKATNPTNKDIQLIQKLLNHRNQILMKKRENY